MKRKLIAAACVLLALCSYPGAGRAAAGLAPNGNRALSDWGESKLKRGTQAEPDVVSHEEQIAELLRKASRAEEKADWHARRAEFWQELAEHQRALGDLASAKEPAAEFLADTHRDQRQRKLRAAQALRQEARQLRERRQSPAQVTPAGGSRNARERQ